MPARSALLRLVADAADQIVHDFLHSQGFKLAPPLAERTIRRYIVQRQFRDVDIEIFRDEGWGAAGGFVRIQTRSLVHPVQQALEGKPQSLLAPRTDANLVKFQLGPHADDVAGSWNIASASDVTKFAVGLLMYLRDIGVPWLKNTESIDAVVAHMTELKEYEERDRLVEQLRKQGHLA
jgi:hypothetical protein